jgi:hypothetical protein
MMFATGFILALFGLSFSRLSDDYWDFRTTWKTWVSIIPFYAGVGMMTGSLLLAAVLYLP